MPPSRLRIVLRRVRAGAERGAEGAARAVGYELRRRSYYLPFPDVERLPDDLWDREHPTAGVDLRIDDATRLVSALSTYIHELHDTAFRFKNLGYEWVDAETLYAMLRHLKPRHVVELGSGVSTRIIALARAANERDGSLFRYDCYDPFPGWHELEPIPGVTVHPVAAENLDADALTGLGQDDVLFVDTTHTVKTGGDVVRIILDLLPRLAPGVYVHFHDIFLPYEYPRRWVVDRRQAWAEQYLLHAFLAFNPTFEVVLPVRALARLRPEMMRRVSPGLVAGGGTGTGAFWIRRLPYATSH